MCGTCARNRPCDGTTQPQHVFVPDSFRQRREFCLPAQPVPLPAQPVPWYLPEKKSRCQRLQIAIHVAQRCGGSARGVSRPLEPLVGRTKVSCSLIWLWLHCAAFLYCTADRPFGDRTPPGNGRFLWPPRLKLCSSSF